MPDDVDDRVFEAERKAHTYARERGLSGPLYTVIRTLASGVLRTWFRVCVSGAGNIPADGGVIVAPNHKNFLDPFFVGIATRRRVRFMAKIELFRGPLAWRFLRLGAFPIRRGGGDADALGRRVQIAFLGAVEPGPSVAGHDPATELIDERVWPAVQRSTGGSRRDPD